MMNLRLKEVEATPQAGSFVAKPVKFTGEDGKAQTKMRLWCAACNKLISSEKYTFYGHFNCPTHMHSINRMSSDSHEDIGMRVAIRSWQRQSEGLHEPMDENTMEIRAELLKEFLYRPFAAVVFAAFQRNTVCCQ